MNVHGDKIKILIISTTLSGSGNKTTAERIQSYFNSSSDLICHLLDARQKRNNNLEVCTNPDIVFGIHTHHCSWYLKDCQVPYAIIFGGTDINEFSKNEEQLKTMTKCINRARFLVCFSDAVFQQAASLWPHRQNCFLKISPGVSVSPDLQFVREWRTRWHVSAETAVFTLIAGIRPVKDPCFLLAAFSEWHKRARRPVRLVIVGGMVDQEFGNAVFLPAIKSSSGVLYVGGLKKSEVHGLIADSFAVVNCSLSEGLAQAILEAMTLGVVVLARRIPANEAIVRDGVTGFLFDTPEEFVSKASDLLDSRPLYTRLGQSALHLMNTTYTSASEAESYCSLARRLASERQSTAKSQL